MILPETGWYRVIASHTQFATDGPVFTERGPYRFLLESRSTAPEQVPETLAVGDSVVTEGLDYLGDWDEFVVNAGPGELAVLVYRAATAAFPRMLAVEGTSFDT